MKNQAMIEAPIPLASAKFLLSLVRISIQKLYYRKVFQRPTLEYKYYSQPNVVCMQCYTYRNRQKSMKCDDTNDLWRRKDETPHQFWHNAGEAEVRCCEKADTYNLFPSCEAPYKITNQNMCNFLALFYFNSGDINQPQNLYESSGITTIEQ